MYSSMYFALSFTLRVIIKSENMKTHKIYKLILIIKFLIKSNIHKI